MNFILSLAKVSSSAQNGWDLYVNEPSEDKTATWGQLTYYNNKKIQAVLLIWS